MSCLEVLKYLTRNVSETLQSGFFISSTNVGQSVFGTTVVFPIFLFPEIISRNLFSFLGTDNGQSQTDPRFKMILWFIIAGTRGGVNRAKILNLIKDTPMNANKIAKVLNLDHKTVIHHVQILSKNDLVVKAQKDYGAEYKLSQIMQKNQKVLEEIVEKIGTK